MLAIHRCFDFAPAVSSKLKWLGTRSPISTNFPDSIFATRMDGTGGIDDPADGAEAIWWLVGGGALFR